MTRRTRTLTALAAVAATAAAVLVAGQGYESAQVRMHAGTVWLASNRTGEAVLADGASAELAAKVPVGAPPAALSVTQQGNAALVLNRKTGVLSRVDSATQEVARSTAAFPPGAGLVLKPAADVVHGVDVHSGMVTSLSPDTLEPLGEPARLAESIRPDNVVADGRGRLWAIDGRTGDLVWLTGGERRTRPAGGTGRLATTGGRPALVDPGRGTAELLDPETGAVVRSVRPDLPADDTVLVGGSVDQARVLIATGTRGDLVVCTFDTGSCAAPVHISSPGAELGTPVESGGHAVVPDYSTGQAVIVDLAGSRVVAHRQLFDRPTRFELVVRDGIVFFNDPDGSTAGVLDLTGVVHTITKYAEGQQESTTPAEPDPRAQGDQVAKKADHKPKPSLKVPGQTLPPAQTNTTPPPPPTLTAAIEVKPGRRGTVGDEFELTMVLQPGGTATTRWWFEGSPATTGPIGATVRQTWHQPGTFTVRATSTFGTGTEVRAETTITVEPAQAPPRITQLHVQRPKPVVGQSVHFNADSTGKPDRWAWTVTRSGRNTPDVTASTPEFDHAFATPGTYTVALTVTAGKHTGQFSRTFTVVRGAVEGWGFDWLGQLEIPDSLASGVIAIDSGGQHSLALKADGSVIAFGSNTFGNLAVPEEATSGVVAIDAGGFHSLALRADGSVVAWGENSRGEVTVPVAAKHDVVAIAAGDSRSLALKADGTVIAWGDEGYNGSMKPPPAALSGVTAIASGGSHDLVVKADGSIVVWGGQRDIEGAVPPEATGDVRSIAAGFMYSVALKADGSMVGWGDNFYKQSALPPAARSGIATMAAGSVHGLALKTDGSVVSWGSTSWGATPVPPEYTSGVLDVAAGQHFSLVLLE